MGSIATNTSDTHATSEKFRTLIRSALFSGRYGYNFRTVHQRDLYRALQIDRRRSGAAARSKAYRGRQKAERLPSATPFNSARYRRDIVALKVWLRENGRSQRKLRARGREIALARLCCATFLAELGRIPRHREMAETLALRTGRGWTVRQGQAALDWIETLQREGVWHPLDEPEGEIPSTWGVF